VSASGGRLNRSTQLIGQLIRFREEFSLVFRRPIKKRTFELTPTLNSGLQFHALEARK